MHTTRNALLTLVLALMAGCGASSGPVVSVLGAEQPRLLASRSLVVFVEVHNPSSRDLRLSRLDYRLDADEWFQTRGTVPVRRAVAAGTSAILEIEVPLKGPAGGAAQVGYQLQGRLFALENAVERSWPVSAQGALHGDRLGFRAQPARVEVAESR